MINGGNHSLCILLALLLLLIHDSATAAMYQDLTVSSSCQSQCGDIAIPYPFGIGKGCYLNKWYEIVCNTSSTSGKLVPFLSGINKKVLNISLYRDDDYGIQFGSVRVKGPIASSGCSGDEGLLGSSLINLTGSPFYVGDRNRLVSVGCNARASVTTVEPITAGCSTTCGARDNTPGGDQDDNVVCNGYRCCQVRPPAEFLQKIVVRTESTEGTSNSAGGGGCRVAFLTDQTYDSSNISEPEVIHGNRNMTIELQWFIDIADLPSGCSDRGSDTILSCGCNSISVYGVNYASCRCSRGYRGNPYLTGGCQDINECIEENHARYCADAICINTVGGYTCGGGYVRKQPAWGLIVLGFGLGFIVGGTYWLYKFIRRRKRMNRQKKFFKCNGGLLLQQQLTSTEGSVEKTAIFTSKELEKATEKFSVNRVLGQGGQGTVYKGMLVDGRIVAVKMSKAVDEDKIEEFINEVVILSQINHRNIVKLLGCCLETDVPLLVYEYIPNGNLFEHLHEGFDDHAMTWEERLRIAIEIAGALSYLHSAASRPIYHRDIKSTNILLDEKYRAKVSDFGTSRSITIDQTHLTTLVAGTFGYLDPEYFQSSQFTDKSDVYSFGVVLVELITGERPVSNVRSEENRGLAAHFTEAMKENRLFDMVDARIKEDSKFEQVMSVAKLARRCLNLKGRKRPTMREVSMELERIRSGPGGSEQHQVESDEEEEMVKLDIGDSWNAIATAPASELVAASPSSLDVEPLFPRQTW